jgi:hypothetical protein
VRWGGFVTWVSNRKSKWVLGLLAFDAKIFQFEASRFFVVFEKRFGLCGKWQLATGETTIVVAILIHYSKFIIV